MFFHDLQIRKFQIAYDYSPWYALLYQYSVCVEVLKTEIQ